MGENHQELFFVNRRIKSSYLFLTKLADLPYVRKQVKGNSLAVRLSASTAGGMGSIMVRELRSCMLSSVAKKREASQP